MYDHYISMFVFDLFYNILLKSRNAYYYNYYFKQPNLKPPNTTMINTLFGHNCILFRVKLIDTHVLQKW